MWNHRDELIPVVATWKTSEVTQIRIRIHGNLNCFNRMFLDFGFRIPYINQVLLEAYDIKQAKPAQRSVCFYSVGLHSARDGPINLGNRS